MTPKRDLPSQKNFATRHAHSTFSQPTPPSHASTFQCNTCNGFGHMAREYPSPYEMSHDIILTQETPSPAIRLHTALAPPKDK